MAPVKPQGTVPLTPPAKGTDEHKRWSAIHRVCPSPERRKQRSKTFPGIAAAVADQWGGWAMDKEAMSTGSTSSFTAATVAISGGCEQRAGDRAPACRRDQQDGGLIHGGA